MIQEPSRLLAAIAVLVSALLPAACGMGGADSEGPSAEQDAADVRRPRCGDGHCSSSESCSSCAADCGACGPLCGDGICQSGEACESCASDCGACPVSNACAPSATICVQDDFATDSLASYSVETGLAALGDWLAVGGGLSSPTGDIGSAARLARTSPAEASTLADGFIEIEVTPPTVSSESGRGAELFLRRAGAGDFVYLYLGFHVSELQLGDVVAGSAQGISVPLAFAAGTTYRARLTVTDTTASGSVMPLAGGAPATIGPVALRGAAAGGRAGFMSDLRSTDSQPTRFDNLVLSGWPLSCAPPAITSFDATPSSIQLGASATLSWTVIGSPALALFIDQGVGAVAGTSTGVTPGATTTYTLTAHNACGTAAREVTITVGTAPVCTYTYSAWGPCLPDGTQTRTQISAEPSGCVGTPVLSQACPYVPPTCTYTYSPWGPCQPDGTQTRSELSATPSGCLGTPLLSQSCTYVPPTSDPWPIVGTSHLYVSPSGSDTSPGTSALPFREVSRAASVASAGTVVHVAPGTYGAVSSSRSGTSSAPITFVSDVKWGARIEAPATLTSAWANSGEWVVIQGFEITGARWNGILTTKSHGRFRGNHIHHVVSPDCSRGGGGIVTENYSETDNDVDGNVIHDIGPTSVSCGLVHGIYPQGPYGGRIINNLVYRASGWGIHLYHNANHLLIANNTVFQNRRAGILIGASYEGNDILPGIDSGTVVINNLVLDNDGGCIEENNLYRTYGNTYASNTCYANRSGNSIVLLTPPAGQPRSTETGTLTSDPRFVNYQPDGFGDYRLQSGSPSANSGTAGAGGFDAPGYDLGLAARPQGSAIDRGAYESW